MKNLIKFLLTLIGCCIFIYGIITEIDGIGRFAVILFGLLFSFAGSMINFKKKK